MSCFLFHVLFFIIARRVTRNLPLSLLKSTLTLNLASAARKMSALATMTCKNLPHSGHHKEFWLPSDRQDWEEMNLSIRCTFCARLLWGRTTYQCDQICRNFSTLANLMPLGTFSWLKCLINGFSPQIVSSTALGPTQLLFHFLLVFS